MVKDATLTSFKCVSFKFHLISQELGLYFYNISAGLNFDETDGKTPGHLFVLLASEQIERSNEHHRRKNGCWCLFYISDECLS